MIQTPQDNSSRLLVLIAGMLAPFLAGLLAKYGFVIPTEQIVAAEVAAAGFIAAHVADSIHSRNVAAAQAAAPTPAAAVADLSAGPKP